MVNKVEFGVVCDGGFSLACFLLESVICKQGRLATLRMVAMTTDVKAPPVSWLPLFSTVLLSWGGLSDVVLCTCKRMAYNGNGWVFPMLRLGSDLILLKIIYIVFWPLDVLLHMKHRIWFNLFFNVGRNLNAKKRNVFKIYVEIFENKRKSMLIYSRVTLLIRFLHREHGLRGP